LRADVQPWQEVCNERCAKDRVDMRKVKRPRQYVAQHWLVLLSPLFRYSQARDAHVLRVVGSTVGPVLRVERRGNRRRRRFDGVERRRAIA
jgi:hypothetical protein